MSSRPRQVLGCVAALAVVAGCGGSAVEEQLETPSYQWNRETSLCGATSAVDGRGGWRAKAGCESGGNLLHFQRVLSEKERARIETAFRALPDPSTFVGVECPNGGERHSFRERAKDGTRREWGMCLEDASYLDLPAAPFSEVVTGFWAISR